MSLLMSDDDDDETVILASSTVIFNCLFQWLWAINASDVCPFVSLLS